MSSQKREGSRGVSIDSSCLSAPSLPFFWTLKGLLSFFKFEKNRFQRLGPKKVGVPLDVESAAKNSEARSDIALLAIYGDTPTVAVTTCGVSLLSCKNIFFGSILHLAVHGRSDTLPAVTSTVAAVGLSSHGL